MSCQCQQQHGLSGLGSLTAGSRVLWIGETYLGSLNASGVIEEFKQYLRQRGLQVESINYQWVSQDFGGLIYRVYAQVVTPIDRAQVDDLTWDIAQDLSRASGAEVTGESISVLYAAQKDNAGNPINAPLPGLPAQPGTSSGLFEGLAASMGVSGETAKVLTIGGGALLLLLILRR